MKASVLRRFGKPEHDKLTAFKRQPGIGRVWRATGVGEAEFDKFYVPMLIKIMEASPDDHYRSDICRLMRGVLVARGGTILGKGLALEDAKRLAEHYTMGLAFVLAVEIYLTLGTSAGEPYATARPTIMTSALLLTPDTLRLLHDCKPVYHAICAYFVDEDRSEYRSLLSRYFSRTDNAAYRYLLGPPSEGDSGPPPTVDHTTDEESTSIALAHGFIDWLSDHLSSQTSLNTASSVVHRLDQHRLFLLKPGAFKAYSEISGKSTEVIIKRLARQGFLERCRDGKYTVLGALNGKTVKGVVLSHADRLRDPSLDHAPSACFTVLEGQACDTA